MKKQYQAPSVEIELQGISNFCVGCADDANVWDWAWGPGPSSECFLSWASGPDSPFGSADACYNGPYSTYMFS